MNKCQMGVIWLLLLFTNCNGARDVGAIAFDPEWDDPNFKICDERVVYEYYQTQLTYQGGTQAVRDLFYERVTKVANISPSNGWITLRFLVNCEDRVGRIRSFGIDQEYNVATIDTELKQQLHTIAKSLEDWSRKAPFDSYYMVRFKIVNGKIQEIF